MKITRQKRPDRVICKWGQNGDYRYEVELTENNDVQILRKLHYIASIVSIPKSEIPNLIKALEEVSK